MNKKTIGIGACVAALIAGTVYFANQEPEKVVYKKYVINAGSYSNPVKPLPGDTVYLKGNYGYITWSNISGDSLNPIVLMGDSVTMNNGLAFFDCKYWRVTGGKNKGIKIGNNPNTVAINVQGKSGHFEIDNINFENVYSALWFKTEPNLYTDTSYWSTLVMEGLYFHDCNIKRAHFEGLYIGSTDQKGDRKCLAADGNFYYPYPASVKNIRLLRINIDSTDRTGAQISGMLYGDNSVRYCNFNICGLSHESNQGAGFRLGGRSKYLTVSNCTFNQTWLYAFQSQGSDTIKFNNNVVNNATKIGTSVNPQLMAAVQFDGYVYPTTLIIKNNTVGWSNSGTGTLITSAKEFLTATGNVFMNNTGSFQNNSGVEFKATQ